MARFVPIEKVKVTDSDIRGNYKYGFHEKENYKYKARKGLDEDVVRMISKLKN